MRTNVKKNTINFKGKMVSIGVDMHKRTWYNTALADLFDYLSAEKKRLTHEVVELSRVENYVQRMKLLKTIPGIGCLSAMEILVELQDITRFQSADELAAYLGLTPSQYSSG